jgi:hypothetical protein
MEKPIPRDVFFSLGRSGLVKGILVGEHQLDEPITLPSIDESDGHFGIEGPSRFSEIVVLQVASDENSYRPGSIITVASSMVFEIDK